VSHFRTSTAIVTAEGSYTAFTAFGDVAILGGAVAFVVDFITGTDVVVVAVTAASAVVVVVVVAAAAADFAVVVVVVVVDVGVVAPHSARDPKKFVFFCSVLRFSVSVSSQSKENISNTSVKCKSQNGGNIVETA
jgi:hypothetical protein